MSEGKAVDRLVVEAERIGSRRREGEILEVLTVGAGGVHYRVCWDDRHESTFFPTAGSVKVIEARHGGRRADAYPDRAVPSGGSGHPRQHIRDDRWHVATTGHHVRWDPIFTWKLRRVLRQVPDAGLRSAIECLRAVAFVQFSLRLASALEDSLQSAAAMRQPTLEYHFHCTHDDLGFGIGIGAFELEMNACQADKVRLMLHRTGECAAERLILSPQMTPERARSEVLGFATAARTDACNGRGLPCLRWLSRPDPAMRGQGRAFLTGKAI